MSLVGSQMYGSNSTGSTTQENDPGALGIIGGLLGGAGSLMGGFGGMGYKPFG
jgi:hypothetical protein